MTTTEPPALLLSFVPAEHHGRVREWFGLLAQYDLQPFRTFARYWWWFDKRPIPPRWYHLLTGLNAANWSGLIADTRGWGKNDSLAAERERIRQQLQENMK